MPMTGVSHLTLSMSSYLCCDMYLFFTFFFYLSCLLLPMMWHVLIFFYFFYNNLTCTCWFSVAFRLPWARRDETPACAYMQPTDVRASALSRSSCCMHCDTVLRGMTLPRQDLWARQARRGARPCHVTGAAAPLCMACHNYLAAPRL